MDNKVLVENASAVSDRLEQVVEKVASYVEAGAEFAVTQAPLLVREILNWEIALRCGAAFVSFVALAFGLWAFRYIYVQERYDRYSRYSDSAVLGMVAAGSVSAVGLATFVYNTFALVKVLVAPRLFLLEYFSHLVK